MAALGATLWLAAALGWRAASSSTSGTQSSGPETVALSPAPPRPPRWRRALGLLAGLVLAVPGAVVAAGFITLDQERAAPAAYASAALLGLVALGLVRLLAWRVPRIFSSFSAF